MTPKEKAEHLVFELFKYELTEQAKQYALICVNEILEATKVRSFKMKPNTVEQEWIYSKWWLEVKTEINNL